MENTNHKSKSKALLTDDLPFEANEAARFSFNSKRSVQALQSCHCTPSHQPPKINHQFTASERSVVALSIGSSFTFITLIVPGLASSFVKVAGNFNPETP
jgi:hypothetical protein